MRKSKLLVRLLLAFASSMLPSIWAAASAKVFPAGDRLHLMADPELIGELSGAELRLGVPVEREVILRSDRPWEGRALYISSTYQHEGVHHMLYRGHNTASGGESARDYYLCLATSRDGISWEKPEIGVVKFAGGRPNNIVGFENGTPLTFCFTFYDPRPETPSDERVKAIFMRDGDRRAGGQGRGLRAQILGSADGRVWRELELGADLRSDWPNAFDGGSVFWSEAEQQFVGYFRWWDEAAPRHERTLHDWMIGRPGVRSVFRSTSRDLRSWSEPEPMGFGGTPREHIYESPTIPYFRNPSTYIVLANRFNPGRRALSLEEERALDISTFSGNANMPLYAFASDANDLVLMFAKPGSSEYHRPFMEAFMRPGSDRGNWSSRCNYPSLSGGVIPTGPAELSFYVTRHHLQPTNHIQRISLRTDGFVSVKAPYAGGEMLTNPLTYSGDHLLLNFATSGAGEIRVEIQDADGRSMAGFGLDDCDPLIGDRVAGIVTWRGRSAVGAFVGKPVRLRFAMTDADLYSLRFAR